MSLHEQSEIELALTPPRYVGGLGSIAEALRHAGKALTELGDVDLAREAEQLAEKISHRARTDDTRELPLPLKET